MCDMCEIDWEVVVSAIGIIVNAILAWWIVASIQKRLSNERTIKDHFISEIKDLRTDCANALRNVFAGKKSANEIISHLKLIGIKSAHLLQILNSKFKIDSGYLNPYSIELNQIITDDDDFVSKINLEDKVVLTAQTKKELLKFQAKHQICFNNLIVLINESEYLHAK